MNKQAENKTIGVKIQLSISQCYSVECWDHTEEEPNKYCKQAENKTTGEKNTVMNLTMLHSVECQYQVEEEPNEQGG